MKSSEHHKKTRTKIFIFYDWNALKKVWCKFDFNKGFIKTERLMKIEFMLFVLTNSMRNKKLCSQPKIHVLEACAADIHAQWHTIFLVSTVAPEIVLPNKRISQSRDRDTMLECLITANPHATIYWEKDGRRITSSSRWVLQEELITQSAYYTTGIWYLSL